MLAVGTRVRVDDRYLGTVVGHGHMGDTLLYIVEWEAGFWAWQANGGGSAAAVEGRSGSPDTFHSRSVVHPGACEEMPA